MIGPWIFKFAFGIAVTLACCWPVPFFEACCYQSFELRSSVNCSTLWKHWKETPWFCPIQEHWIAPRIKNTEDFHWWWLFSYNYSCLFCILMHGTVLDKESSPVCPWTMGLPLNRSEEVQEPLWSSLSIGLGFLYLPQMLSLSSSFILLSGLAQRAAWGFCFVCFKDCRQPSWILWKTSMVSVCSCLLMCWDFSIVSPAIVSKC